MSAQHTPGPWVLWERTPGDGHWLIATAPEDTPGAKWIVAPDDGWNSGYADAAEREANAHLIAAAPEMREGLDEALAGLEFAVAVIQERGGCNCSRLDGSGAGFVCSPHKALSSVRAAIRKAEARA